MNTAHTDHRIDLTNKRKANAVYRHPDRYPSREYTHDPVQPT